VIVLVNANSLIGKRVIGAKALVLGEVESVNLDVVTWLVTHLGVGLTEEATKELGFKKPFLSHVVISLPVSTVSVVGDVVTLDESIKSLKDVVARLDKK
jgi:sporulation protein YlmC with PRC-barrel domain